MKFARIVLAALASGVLVLGPTMVASADDGDVNMDAQPSLAPVQLRLLSGFAHFELTGSSANSSRGATNYSPRGSGDCATNLGSNVKVNQNCLNISDGGLQGRGQSQNETSIAQDPNNPNHLVASFNDYRRGDGNCYTASSVDGGHTWNDSTVPMSFTNGFPGFAREYWQAGGDTSVAFDTKGNAYLSCQVFNRGQPVSPNPDTSSAFLLFRSTGNDGASWNFPGRYVTVMPLSGPQVSLLDKQLMTVDNHVGSPFQDRIYVTWTTFAADGTAYIYEAFSSDYGEHFSAPHLVSANSSLCTLTYGLPTPNGNCNENQFSQPFTGSDGALYVAWANFNNTPVGSDNRNQMLLAKSTDGGNTFSAPIKVADYYDLPDCATYQNGADLGRACVPEKGSTTDSIFRATNYPSGAVNPMDPKQVVVSLGSYINPHSNEANGCVPAGTSPVTGNDLYTGVKTPGACNNDILLSVSNDGGATFTGTTTDPRKLQSVTTDPGQATTDQWFQWLSFTKNGALAVSYYDRQYGSDEATGWSDVSLSSSGSLSQFAVQRATSGSMPPPTQFGGVFWGDYAGLSAVNQALPLWSDTRSTDLFTCGTGVPQLCTGTEGGAQAGLSANDQDIFVTSMGVSGR